jgi:hypothetical protein
MKSLLAQLADGWLSRPCELQSKNHPDTPVTREDINKNGCRLTTVLNLFFKNNKTTEKEF